MLKVTPLKQCVVYLALVWKGSLKRKWKYAQPQPVFTTLSLRGEKKIEKKKPFVSQMSPILVLWCLSSWCCCSTKKQVVCNCLKWMAARGRESIITPVPAVEHGMLSINTLQFNKIFWSADQNLHAVFRTYFNHRWLKIRILYLTFNLSNV